MEKLKLTRRNLILRTPAFLAGLLLFGGGMLRSASAAETKSLPKRPPGSCSAWSDKDGDGCCDRSKSCRKQNCPAHANNSKRKSNAPQGACALWKDPENQGFCEISSREERPCQCVTCPANRDHES